MKKYTFVSFLALLLTLAFLPSCALFDSKDELAGKSFSFLSLSCEYKCGKEEFYEKNNFYADEEALFSAFKASLGREDDGKLHISETKGADNCTLDGKAVEAYEVNYMKTGENSVKSLCSYIPGSANIFYQSRFGTGFFYEKFAVLGEANVSSNTKNGVTVQTQKKLSAYAAGIRYDEKEKKLYIDFELSATETRNGETVTSLFEVFTLALTED